MNYCDYAVMAHESAIYTLNPAEVFVGAISETGETLEQLKYALRSGQLDVNKIKFELGDVLWYVVVAADSTGVFGAIDMLFVAAQEFADPLSAMLTMTPLIATLKMSATAGTIADLYADCLLTGASILDPGNREALASHLVNLVAWVMVLARKVGLTMDEILRSNLDKLAYRRAHGKEKAHVVYPCSISQCGGL